MLQKCGFKYTVDSFKGKKKYLPFIDVIRDIKFVIFTKEMIMFREYFITW